MAKKGKEQLPPTGAGLVRYFEDEETGGPKLTPEQVVAMTVILGIFCIVLRFSG
jgi:preprotein translocase subunit Sec61beta